MRQRLGRTQLIACVGAVVPLAVTLGFCVVLAVQDGAKAALDSWAAFAAPYVRDMLAIILGGAAVVKSAGAFAGRGTPRATRPEDTAATGAP